MPLRADEPEGAIEQLLVEQLIGFQWRWRRVLRYENAALRSQCRDAVEQARRPPPRYGKIGIYTVPIPGETRDLDAELRDLDADLAARPELTRHILESAEPEFDLSVNDVLSLTEPWDEHHGYTKEQIEQVIAACCAGGDGAGYWAELRALIIPKRDEVAAEIAARETSAATATDLALISSEPRRFSVQCYEAHISRQFYRALHELTRLQSARAPSPAPPPLPSPFEGEGPGMRGDARADTPSSAASPPEHVGAGKPAGAPLPRSAASAPVSP